MGACESALILKLKFFMKEIYQTITYTVESILKLGLVIFPTLLEGILPIRGVAALGGSSDLGKSRLLLQLCICVVSGAGSFLGFKLNVKKRSAIFVSTEDDDYSTCIRLNQLKKHLNEECLHNLRFLFDTNNLLENLDQELTLKPASLIIIDTFGDIFPGTLNDSISVRRFLKGYRELAYKHDCLIIFNHHCSKRNDSRIPSKDNLLGSQGFESSIRTVLELRADLWDNKKRHLCIVKGNEVAPEFKNDSFEMSFDFEEGFLNTGVRVPFAKLAITPSKAKSMNVDSRLAELKQEGKSIREATEKLNTEGFEIGKSTVGKMFKTSFKDQVE